MRISETETNTLVWLGPRNPEHPLAHLIQSDGTSSTCALQPFPPLDSSAQIEPFPNPHNGSGRRWVDSRGLRNDSATGRQPVMVAAFEGPSAGKCRCCSAPPTGGERGLAKDSFGPEIARDSHVEGGLPARAEPEVAGVGLEESNASMSAIQADSHDGTTQPRIPPSSSHSSEPSRSSSSSRCCA